MRFARHRPDWQQKGEENIPVAHIPQSTINNIKTMSGEPIEPIKEYDILLGKKEHQTVLGNGAFNKIRPKYGRSKGIDTRALLTEVHEALKVHLVDTIPFPKVFTSTDTTFKDLYCQAGTEQRKLVGPPMKQVEMEVAEATNLRLLDYLAQNYIRNPKKSCMKPGWKTGKQPAKVSPRSVVPASGLKDMKSQSNEGSNVGSAAPSDELKEFEKAIPFLNEEYASITDGSQSTKRKHPSVCSRSDDETSLARSTRSRTQDIKPNTDVPCEIVFSSDSESDEEVEPLELDDDSHRVWRNVTTAVDEYLSSACSAASNASTLGSASEAGSSTHSLCNELAAAVTLGDGVSSNTANFVSEKSQGISKCWEDAHVSNQNNPRASPESARSDSSLERIDPSSTSYNCPPRPRPSSTTVVEGTPSRRRRFRRGAQGSPRSLSESESLALEVPHGPSSRSRRPWSSTPSGLPPQLMGAPGGGTAPCNANSDNVRLPKKKSPPAAAAAAEKKTAAAVVPPLKQEVQYKPVIDATINCACSVYQKHIENSLQSASQPAAPSPATARLNLDIFRDDFECPAPAHRRRPAAVPSVATIQAFYEEFYQHYHHQMKYGYEAIIMSLIYVERLMEMTQGALHPTPENWSSILVSCLILAGKVYGESIRIKFPFVLFLFVEKNANPYMILLFSLHRRSFWVVH